MILLKTSMHPFTVNMREEAPGGEGRTVAGRRLPLGPDWDSASGGPLFNGLQPTLR